MLPLCTQVYDLDTFKVTHASKYPGPVLSLGISPDCGLLAVGQADGQLSIRKHATPKVVPVGAGMSLCMACCKSGNSNLPTAVHSRQAPTLAASVQSGHVPKCNKGCTLRMHVAPNHAEFHIT